ncbi:MAG: hypothetical protein KDB23_22155 [Planctomycetales bacterium]|nr:hypothetical protein [Planctomycetales bacterium]
MATEDYRYETLRIDGFLSQLVRYITQGGHYFYIRCLVPEQKDPHVIADKLLTRYGIRRKRWERKRRNLKDAASIHFLMHGRLFVIMLSKGRHQQFYADHGGNVLDVRRTAMKAFGYSIRYSVSAGESRPKVSIRLDQETYRNVKAHMLTIAAWDSYRDKARLEGEFRRLPYQSYSPVYQQLYGICRMVNRARRRRGFEPIELRCVRRERHLQKVFREGPDTSSA